MVGTRVDQLEQFILRACCAIYIFICAIYKNNVIRIFNRRIATIPIWQQNLAKFIRITTNEYRRQERTIQSYPGSSKFPYFTVSHHHHIITQIPNYHQTCSRFPTKTYAALVRDPSKMKYSKVRQFMVYNFRTYVAQISHLQKVQTISRSHFIPPICIKSSAVRKWPLNFNGSVGGAFVEKQFQLQPLAICSNGHSHLKLTSTAQKKNQFSKCAQAEAVTLQYIPKIPTLLPANFSSSLFPQILWWYLGNTECFMEDLVLLCTYAGNKNEKKKASRNSQFATATV